MSRKFFSKHRTCGTNETEIKKIKMNNVENFHVEIINMDMSGQNNSDSSL
jgi:hypothetical protein